VFAEKSVAQKNKNVNDMVDEFYLHEL